ncbi:glycerol-3-phosphate 1-O-acyltransferase PlsY [Gemella sp. GH3]|uniref:glycerol-3-phosphate 1-O-acyltransferase PlsY n=1 Tax=unclassified Gemella TaxID=2624949 RepID=UPI0015CFC83E|nr:MULTISPECIES: glycerol-3-phosphate 1-O-acyltransferase PlsY [unclassified Gemella]MBF0713477.1 glycerol-3-phosphate 1-O-acyltransferase PlsY [Gemella sp. GH3.1]NYS50429.1 glycerol-3-phosphate 1-O-acyltransferase PlsY [Gemella sp. GH3]
MINIISLIIFSYLLGSIPFALIIGKIFFRTDIRNLGSGNLGTTNTMRILGRKAGLVVFFLDFAKGYLSLKFASFILGDVDYIIIFGAFAMIGHMFPIFANFRGGKSVATGSSLFVYFYPYLALILIVVFFVNLLLTGYVSLGSIIISAIGSAYITLYGEGMYRFILVAMCVLVIYMHRSNIKRILNGTENVSKLKINFRR